MPGSGMECEPGRLQPPGAGVLLETALPAARAWLWPLPSASSFLSRLFIPSPEMSRHQIWMLALRSRCLPTFSPGSTFPPHLDCRCLGGLQEPWAASLKESQWWASTASSGSCHPHPGLLVVTTRTQTRFSHQGPPSWIPALAPWPPAPTALPAPARCPHRAGLTHGCSPRDVMELSP